MPQPQQSIVRNRLLKALSADDFALLQPHLRPMATDLRRACRKVFWRSVYDETTLSRARIVSTRNRNSIVGTSNLQSQVRSRCVPAQLAYRSEKVCDRPFETTLGRCNRDDRVHDTEPTLATSGSFASAVSESTRVSYFAPDRWQRNCLDTPRPRSAHPGRRCCQNTAADLNCNATEDRHASQ